MKFTKKLLYTKETKPLIENYMAKIQLLQTVRNEVELILKRSLEDGELLDLANDTTAFVIKLKAGVKANFHFPDADDIFNLNALGLNYKDLDEAMSKLPMDDNKYDVVNNMIMPNDSEIKKLENSQKVWTTNQRQNDLLVLCQNLCKNLRELNELQNITSLHYMKNISKGLLKLEYENGKLVPMVNVEKIAAMN